MASELPASVVAKLNNLGGGMPPSDEFELGDWLDTCRVRPSVATVAALPASDNETNDLRWVADPGQWYYWTGSAWSVPDAPSRGSLSGTDIDWSESEILTKTLTGNTTLTASNLVLDKVVLLIVDGDFTLTLPSGTVTLNGEYDGTVTNYIYLHCIDTSAPEFLATISQEV